MKKIIFILVVFLSSCSPLMIQKKLTKLQISPLKYLKRIKRISVGNERCKKLLLLLMSLLTCSHCANFHKDVYPQLKKEYIDTGFSKNRIQTLSFRYCCFSMLPRLLNVKQDQSLEILESLYSNQQAWIKGSTVDAM